MKKRLFAALLCIMMVLTLLPVMAFAASTITFTTQPEANTFVTAGKITGSFTAQASVSDSGTPTLNWYACSESGVISGNSLGTGESFTIPTDLAVDVYFYCCQATCEGAEPVNSRVAAVLVAPDITFTTQPAEKTTVTAGSITGNLTVETSVYPANTTGVTLNWYRASSGGEFIYGESLGTGKTFAIPNMLAPGTYYYLCQATIGTSLTVNSSVAEVTVEEVADATSTISFTTQPNSGTTYVTEGIISEVLTASASVSPSGTPTLNWYQCTGSSGVVTGAPSLGTGETFAIPTDLLDLGKEYYYICQATYPGAAPVNSKVSTVRVSKANETSPVLGFTTHPAPSTTVMEGSISGSLTAEAKVVPLDLTPDLEWYACDEKGIKTGSVLSTAETFTIPTDLKPGTYYYKCKAYCEDTSPTVAWTRVATVTVLPAGTVVATPTFTPVAGTYTSAQNVTLACDTKDATIRYTTNGDEPTASSTEYTTETISVTKTTTIKAKAFKDGITASQTASATYTISQPPVETVATPTFTPVAGTYTSAQKVTLACDTKDATIRYTTNGDEPTESSPAYSTAIAVPSTMTIKAKAFKEGMTASQTASVTYTISVAPPPPIPIKYLVIEGANNKWTAGSDDALTVKVNGDYKKFQGVSVDGSIISDDKYSDKSGSTIVTLKTSYLETLALGRHTLSINFTDGYAETGFTVAAKEQAVTPQTGDSSNAMLWIALLLIGAIGLIVTSDCFRKKRHSAAK